jgi:hypothetical protein
MRLVYGGGPSSKMAPGKLAVCRYARPGKLAACRYAKKSRKNRAVPFPFARIELHEEPSLKGNSFLPFQISLFTVRPV